MDCFEKVVGVALVTGTPVAQLPDGRVTSDLGAGAPVGVVAIDAAESDASVLVKPAP